MSADSRWILWGAGLLAGIVALALLIGALAPAGRPADAGLYFDPAFIARAGTYNRARYLIFLAGQTLAVAVLAMALRQGWDRQAVHWAGSLTGHRPLLTVVGVGILITLVLTVADLPAGLVRFVLDHRYGLSTQPAGLWLADLLTSTGIGLAFGIPLTAGLFWLISRWPTGWWAPAALGFTLYLVVSSLLSPVVVDPLFHRFTPLTDPVLAGEVRAMASRAGLPVQEVLVMDASRRTRRVNAYFTGFGGTRRIVLYDTLLSRYDHSQVLLVLAHELGHWRLHHIYQGIALGAAGSAAVFWLAQRLLAGTGRPPADPVHLVLLMLFVSLVSLAAMPLQNAISRTFERQADRYALALTRDGPGLARLDRNLALDNLADVTPHPYVVRVLFSHPPTLERMRSALNPP